MAAHTVLQLVALRREVSQRRGQFGEGEFGVGEYLLSGGDALIDTAAALDARPNLILEFDVFSIESLQSDVGIRRLALLAGNVGHELRQAAIPVR